MKKPLIILDASVCAKWFFAENDSEMAIQIKNDFTQEKVSIAVPLLIYYEISNILKSAIKKYSIDTDEIVEIYKEFVKLNIISYSSEYLLEEALRISIESDITTYDASYVALSEYLESPLYTSDLKLINKTKNNHNLVFNLKQYGL